MVRAMALPRMRAMASLRANWLLILEIVAGIALFFYGTSMEGARAGSFSLATTSTKPEAVFPTLDEAGVRGNHSVAMCCLDARWRLARRRLAETLQPEPACPQIACGIQALAVTISPTLRALSKTAGRGIFAEVTPMRETPEVTQGRMFMLRNLMTYVEPDVAAADQIKEWTIKTFSRNQRLKSALGDAWGGLRGRTSCITVILTCDATLNLALPPSAPAAPRARARRPGGRGPSTVTSTTRWRRCGARGLWTSTSSSGRRRSLARMAGRHLLCPSPWLRRRTAYSRGTQWHG